MFLSFIGSFVHQGLHLRRQVQEFARLPETRLQQEVL
jgi:hypothetical protein